MNINVEPTSSGQQKCLNCFTLKAGSACSLRAEVGLERVTVGTVIGFLGSDGETRGETGRETRGEIGRETRGEAGLETRGDELGEVRGEARGEILGVLGDVTLFLAVIVRPTEE